jgi:cell division septum initiation protein DivIVA
MNHQLLNDLTTNLRQILNLIRDYKEQIIYLQEKWAETQDTHSSRLFLTQITNCEAQIKHNEKQYKQTINQINELLQ